MGQHLLLDMGQKKHKEHSNKFNFLMEMKQTKYN